MVTKNNTKNVTTATKKSFFKDLKFEFKRITWAPKKDVKKATTTVLVFCLVYMVIVGSLDYIFNNIFKLIFKL